MSAQITRARTGAMVPRLFVHQLARVVIIWLVTSVTSRAQAYDATDESWTTGATVFREESRLRRWRSTLQQSGRRNGISATILLPLRTSFLSDSPISELLTWYTGRVSAFCFRIAVAQRRSAFEAGGKRRERTGFGSHPERRKRPVAAPDETLLQPCGAVPRSP
jgi:hypothetical protein